MSSNQRVLAVLGPTASGKTSYSLKLAEENNGEIVNCDSRQVYKHLIIGAASPSEADKARLPHHLFNFLEPSSSFSASDYQEAVVPVIKELWSRGKTPVLVGGTGFYYAAVAEGLGEAGHCQKLAKELAQELNEKGLAHMVEQLANLDPAGAASIDTNNPRRVLRALEIVRLTKKSFLDNCTVSPFPNAEFEAHVIQMERGLLHQRIERRVWEMVEAGLEAEVRWVEQRYGRGAAGLNSIGYKEWLPFFDGEVGLEQVVERIVVHTRQYAKRQCTWFGKRPEKRKEIILPL
jgi:tRNA dimethylallyltransferase